MLRQPKLEKALDAHLPEMQLRIEDMPIGGGQRKRDPGMGM